MRIESKPIFQKSRANSALPASKNARVRGDRGTREDAFALLYKAVLEASVKRDASVGWNENACEFIKDHLFSARSHPRERERENPHEGWGTYPRQKATDLTTPMDN